MTNTPNIAGETWTVSTLTTEDYPGVTFASIVATDGDDRFLAEVYNGVWDARSQAIAALPDCMLANLATLEFLDKHSPAGSRNFPAGNEAEALRAQCVAALEKAGIGV